MINILHGIAALLLGVLLELLAGNWYVVIPFSLCILNRITAKFPLPWVFLCGFLTGLVMDLIYWRSAPGSALAAGLTVLAVRLLSDRAKIRITFFDSLFKGALTGVLAVILTALFCGYADSRRFPYKYHLITSLSGATVLQVLISPFKKGNEGSERPRPPKEREQGRNTPPAGGKKKTPKGGTSGRSGKKKQV